MKNITAKYVILDTETCGLNPPPAPASGVVQVAWAEICPDTLEVLSSNSSLCNPQAPIHPEASKVHGYSNEDVADMPVLQDVLKLDGPIVLICHNLSFDSKFVSRYIENLTGGICTLQLARHHVKDSTNHKLATLAEHFKLDTGKAHDALGDVHTTTQLLRKLVELTGRSLPQMVSAGVKAKNFHTMPFGKHKGRLLMDLPIAYVNWFLDQEIDQDLRYSLEQTMKVR